MEKYFQQLPTDLQINIMMNIEHWQIPPPKYKIGMNVKLVGIFIIKSLKKPKINQVFGNVNPNCLINNQIGNEWAL